jgi:hypothetical protein
MSKGNPTPNTGREVVPGFGAHENEDDAGWLPSREPA